jgi:hypothetical protein
MSALCRMNALSGNLIGLPLDGFLPDFLKGAERNEATLSGRIDTTSRQ